VFAASGLVAQQQPERRPTPMLGMVPTAPPEMLEIYQIDLLPSGSGFALNKPVLEGDVYVFKVWPEKTTIRLKKDKVRKITQRTKDLNKEVVYQIDLIPIGRMVAREEPVLKGKTYTFHTYKEGKLMSLRQSDILRITRLTGLPAFKVQQEEKGAALIGNLPMEGGGEIRVISQAPVDAVHPEIVNPSVQNPNVPGGNWNYDGQPGATDAYAPANAVVERPGDPPKAPTPRP
jgi:hypothetical protein